MRKKTEKFSLPQNILFSEIGSTGLTRFGGRVQEEWLRELQGSKAHKIYKEMRDNHAVINAVFFGIEMALRQVRFYAEGDDAEGKEFLDECLEDMSASWQDTLTQILTMLQFGWSFTELVYKRRDGELGESKSKYDDGKIGWRKWLSIGQDTLTTGNGWVFDDTGGIQGINQTPPPDYRQRTVPIEKGLLFRTSIAKGNPEGRSILRGMYLSYFYSKQFAEIEGIAAERMGTGLPVMYIGKNGSKSGGNSDLEQAKRIVRDVRVDDQMGIVIPGPKQTADGEGMLFELVSPPSRGAVDFDAVIQRYDQRIALSVLAQFIMLGQNAVGSYALSKSQGDIFMMALSAWAEMICDTINRYAIPRLFELNTFNRAQMPRLAHSEIFVPDLADMSAFINTMVGAGVIKPDATLERTLREMAKLPGAEAPVVVTTDSIESPPKDTIETPDSIDGFVDKFKRRAYGRAKYETATNDYQTELEAIYADWYNGLAKDLDKADADKREEILVAALPKLEKQLKDAGHIALPDAMKLGAAGIMSARGYQQLADTLAENDAYIESSLIPAIRERARREFGDAALWAGGTVAVAGVFAPLLGRVATYASAFWQSIHHGIGDWIGQQDNPDQIKVRRVLDPRAQHCQDCPRLAQVYESWEQMEQMAGIPSDGNTACRANCRCHVEVWYKGDWVRLSENMSGRQLPELFAEGRWVTINGRRILIGDGEGQWNPSKEPLDSYLAKDKGLSKKEEVAASKEKKTEILPKVGSIPVKDVLKFTKPRAQKGLAEVANAIDSIHSIPDTFQDVDVKESAVRSRYGAYKRGVKMVLGANGIVSPVQYREISMSSQGSHRELTFAHEFGHYVEQQGKIFEDPGSQSDFTSAVKQTKAWKTLNELRGQKTVKIKHSITGDLVDYSIDRKYVSYQLQGNELWARSYAQYVARKSGLPTLTEQLNTIRKQQESNPYTTQWDDDDFSPIEGAIDGIIARKGWKK